MWIRTQVRTEERDPKTDPHCGCGYQSCTADPQILTPHPPPICERPGQGKKCAKDETDDFYGAQISVIGVIEPTLVKFVN